MMVSDKGTPELTMDVHNVEHIRHKAWSDCVHCMVTVCRRTHTQAGCAFWINSKAAVMFAFTLAVHVEQSPL